MLQETSSYHEEMTKEKEGRENIIVRGYISHQHPDVTSEGFGSHARGVIYPFLHIAITTDLQPVFWEFAYASNAARDYHGLDVGSFLGLAQEPPPGYYKEIEINTWSDPVVGSACGDAIMLASMIQDNLDEWTRDSDLPLFIRLVGCFRYMNPTKFVWEWLQRHSDKWLEANAYDCKLPLRIAAHLRVPEEFCPQSWKDDNAPSKLTAALERIQSVGVDLDSCQVEVYTEERFLVDDERRIKELCQYSKVYRGTSATLLSDVMSMATADVFIPSSSHLSTMVGYLSHGLIVLADSSRWEYFEPHQRLGNQIIDISDKNLQSVVQGVQRKVAPNDDVT